MGKETHSSFKNLGLLLQGQFVSNFGNQIYDISMLLWLKELTGSATLMGVAMLLTNLPEALLAPFGGRWADRFGRVRTLILSDLVSGFSLGIVILACLFPSGMNGKLLALSLTNLLLGISASCFVPAVSSLIPSLVSDRHLDRANAAHQFSRVGARVVGQAVGSLIFVRCGALWAFVINALSFFLSALTESFIRIPGNREGRPREEGEGESLIRDTWRIMRGLWYHRAILRLLLMIGVFHLALSSLPIVLPFFAQHRLGVGDKWFGFLVTSYTIGIMAGFVAAGLLSSVVRNRQRTIAASAATVGVLFCLTGVSTTVWVAWSALFGVGMGIGIVIVNLMTELQLSTNEVERGATMGAAHAVGGCSLPIGMAGFGVLLDLLRAWGFPYASTTEILLVACGGLALLSSLTLFFRART